MSRILCAYSLYFPLPHNGENDPRFTIVTVVFVGNLIIESDNLWRSFVGLTPSNYIELLRS
jgi:hypothetical protein